MIRTIGTRGGSVPTRVEPLSERRQTSEESLRPRPPMAISGHSCACGVLSPKGNGLKAVAAIPLLFLAGCLGNDPPPVSTIPTTAAACEALRPGFPITYSGHDDTPETVRQVRSVNARFAAACP